MNLETFLKHHQLTENPFNAEEARHDPVFHRLVGSAANHPDFDKVLGRFDQPSAAVVFGEKGSGKTAIRLLMGKRIRQHNEQNPDQRLLLVAYDDLNPVLDRLAQRHGGGEAMLKNIRLVDHQDAILGLAVTRLTDALLDESPSQAEPILMPDDLKKRIKAMPRRQRVDLMVLAALYDQPGSGAPVDRWRRLWSKLRLGWKPSIAPLRALAIVLSIAAVGLGVAAYSGQVSMQWLLTMVAGVMAAAAVIAWVAVGLSWLRLWRLSRAVQKAMPAISRSAVELREMFHALGASELAQQPLPGVFGCGKTSRQSDNDGPTTRSAAASDARYQLTRKLLEAMRQVGYTHGLIVLVDRVDEPTLVSGRADRMRSVVWPMFDNKFLQQEGVGVKLLLPIELRYMLARESADFFQEARLDKQNLIDRLTWSGATLYDLCSQRLRACRATGANMAGAGSASGGGKPITLTDLFDADVTRDLVADALDQMQQPRDAFKFLYAVLQEHCRISPEEQPRFAIARLTLESVRRSQSQRVMEFSRGLVPG